MEEMNKVLELLHYLFKDRDWFDSVGVEKHGRPTVYIKYSCEETLYDIPDYVGGRQVLSHFASSKGAREVELTFRPHEDNIPIPLTNKIPDVADEVELEDPDGTVELPSSFLEYDLTGLCKELDRLEKQCGSNCLQDIFYEVHDGRNAVTNNSARYPEVRSSLEKLYKEYGFDVIYEELDG
jgi:hypothetical protein